MKNDDIFAFDGVEYLAVDSDMSLVDRCEGCQLKGKWPCIHCRVLCAPPDRTDGRDVIYVRREDEK